MDTTATTAPWTRVVVCLASATAFVLIYLWAVTTAQGQQFDASTLALGNEWREQFGEQNLARVADLAPWVLVVPAAVVLAVTALRGRWRLALIAAALPVVIYAIATLLHDTLLPRPYLGDFGYAINTVPSERLAVAIACCCVMVWLAPRFAPRAVLVPVLALAAGLVGALEVAAFSSRFADVVACAPLVGVLAAWWLPTGARRSRAVTIAATALVGVLGAAGIVLMVRWAGADYDAAAMTPGLVGTALCVAAGVIALGAFLRRQE